MSYCINPKCQSPYNEQGGSSCVSCGASLLLGDRYLALKLIGQGGFGRTFLAVDESQPTKPRCVIKQFLPPNISTSAASQLFREEAERLKSLGSYPQIPTFLDYLEIDQQRYIIQEFIDGSNLEQELEETGAFNEDQIRQLLKDILPVLEFVHNHSVIHRDIKLENIIRRSSDRRLTLVDFGAAKYATGTALIKTGTTIGSAGYTAPEQLMGKAVFQSDLYSLGVTCIHLLTQVPPFDLVDSAEGNWVWRDYLNSPVSEQLGSILDKLLERGTRKRYTSATEVMSDLVAKPSVQSIAISPVDTIQKERFALRLKIMAVGCGAVVGLGGGVLLHDLLNQSPVVPPIFELPQIQTQPRLIPSPKTSPIPQNLQPKAEVLDDDKLISLISIIGRISSILLMFLGMAKTRSCFYMGADLSPGLSRMLLGVMLGLMFNIIPQQLLSTSANDQLDTSISTNENSKPF